MPLPLAETTTDLGTELIEELDFDHTPKCDNETCDNDATHIIRCNCGKGTEFSCFACITGMLNAATINPIGGLIIFDPNKSCGHATLITLCEISPL